MNVVIVSGMDINDVLRRCMELESRGYECTSRIKTEYLASKQYHTRVNSHSKLNRTTFAGMEDRVKYRAVYRKEATTSETT